MRALRALLTLAMAAALACGETEETPARTQITLRVQRIEHPDFARLTHLQAEVFRLDAGWQAVSRVRLAKDQLRLPLDLPIVPVSERALTAPFEVVLEALAGDERLAQTRVVSSYAPNSLRLLEVWMHSCNGRPSACVERDCHGPECAACNPAGECRPVGLSEGLELPLFDPDLPPAVKAAPTAR